MLLAERKQIVMNAIREMENRILILQCEDYSGRKSFTERREEAQALKGHLFWANRALLLIVEEEMQGVA